MMEHQGWAHFFLLALRCMLPIHMGKHDLFVNCSDAADAPVGYGRRKKILWCQKYVSLCQKFMGREEEFAPKNVHVNISKNDLYQKSTLNMPILMLSIEYKVSRFSNFSSDQDTPNKSMCSYKPWLYLDICQGVRYSDLMGLGQKIENIFVQLLSEISWIFGLFTFFSQDIAFWDTWIHF